MRITTIVGTALALALLPQAASAAGLRGACAALDRAGNASCALEQGADWKLTTSLLVGGGDKARVTRVERRFCETARSRGVSARVVRWNRMPGPAAPAAKLEWSCAERAVSAAPPGR